MPYHINYDGDVHPCRASSRACPYGQDEHFENEQAARENFEMRLNAVMTMKTLSETSRTFSHAPDPQDDNFPGRFVPRFRKWEQNEENYLPPHYVTPKISKRINAGGEKNVDPEWHRRWEREIQWANVDYPRMQDNVPLNPAGRTGLTGLGGCKRLGENRAADPIVTRLHPATGEHQTLLARKQNEHYWCLPGGTVDEGEMPGDAASRELREETGIVADMLEGHVVYQGYVDDERNTDNAWFASQARHLHLTGEAASQEPSGADDVEEARWVSTATVNMENVFPAHGHMLRLAGLI